MPEFLISFEMPNGRTLGILVEARSFGEAQAMLLAIKNTGEVSRFLDDEAIDSGGLH